MEINPSIFIEKMRGWAEKVKGFRAA